jgi:hypothetical protein
MIRLGISPRDRRTATIGVIVVGTLVAVTRGLPALSTWERTRVAEAEEVAARAASARASVRLLPTLRDSLVARRRQLATIESTMLSGTSSAAAAARLASALDAIATSSRVKVTAMQLRADSTSARVAVRVLGTTDVAGLAALLRAVEGHAMRLVVRELSVAPADPAAPAGKAELLRIDVLVEGIARIVAQRRT